MKRYTKKQKTAIFFDVKALRRHDVEEWRKLSRYVFVLCKEIEVYDDRWDMVQEKMYRLCKTRSFYRYAGKSFKGYVITSVRNNVDHYIERTSRRDDIIDKSHSVEDREETGGSLGFRSDVRYEEVDTSTYQEQLFEEYERIYGGFSRTEAFIIRYYLDNGRLDYSDIARLLGKKIGAIRTAACRMRARFLEVRKKIDEE